MAALLTITVLDPQDILDTFGSDARVYISRGTTDDVDDASPVSSVAVIAGTTQYEYSDPAGTPGTDRYWLRYGTETPSVADDYSAWTGPILAGALAGGPLTLESYKTWAYEGSTPQNDVADDGWLTIAIGAVNRAIVGGNGVGIDLGPSPDTTRQYDAEEVVRDGRRLWVPGGIRSFLTVATGDGTSWEDISAYVRIGPLAHSRPTGEPGAYIEVIPGQSHRLDTSYFVRVTATAFAGFGWDAWPMDLVQAAVAAVKRMVQDRQMRTEYPTETNALRYLDPRLLAHYRNRHFPAMR
jgi:hypothetical protein